MKSKIQSILWKTGGVLFIIVLLVVYNWYIRLGDKERRERKLEARMHNHNHLFAQDLISLQKSTLAQAQSKLGSNTDPGVTNKWMHGNTSVSRAGYPFSVWDFYNPKTSSDPYSYVNSITCFDIQGSLLIQYTTDDPAYGDDVAFRLKHTDNFLAESNVKDGNGATMKLFNNKTDNIRVAVVTMPKSEESRLSIITIIGSSSNVQKAIDGQLDIKLK